MKLPETLTDWRLLAVVLAALIIAGGVIIGLKYRPAPGLELSLSPEANLRGSIYVGGQVNNPGIYPLLAGDSIDDVLRAAGGVKEEIGSASISLIVSGSENNTSQKININRADAWLLQALPGIGENRALSIIDYRTRHGYFRDIYELTNVSGLGGAVFENIKDLVSVSD